MIAEPMKTTSTLSSKDRNEHILIRMGYKRMQHRVESGLYSIGNPGPGSPVMVTANYKLSFDALRANLEGVDAYLLVLDTKGVNVWCAAGKGTFSTDELVRQVGSARLGEVVSHRRLILPQLGAPGVDANEVAKRTGFAVDYGPVRAEDVKAYIAAGITPEMRRVRFPLKERAVLIPVEMKNYLLPLVLIAAALIVLGQLIGALMVATIFLAGVALFPILLPLLPTRDFSSKGMIMGVIVALPFSVAALLQGASLANLLYAIASPLLIAPWVGYISLNFTGCSTYTSRTGVRREIFRYVPVMAVMFIFGVCVTIFAWFAKGWSS
jgi:hypothetical protein